MKLEEQVTSLKLSKKLKELGVKQEYQKGDWCYENVQDGRLLLVRDVEEEYLEVIFPFAKQPNDYDPVKMRHSLVKAFTVAELGELLPARKMDKESGYFESNKDLSGMWRVYWTDTTTGEWNVDFNEVSEANARAKMLIYLIENKLI